MKKMAFLLILALISCNYDSIVIEEPECSDIITYEEGIRDIINFSCATVGCHVAGVPGTGDFSDYQSMKSYLTSGLFKNRIFDGSMPPTGSPQLTDQELESIRCWIEADYPEN